MNGRMIGAGEWHLTVDELNARGAAAGIQTWPVVLDIAPPSVRETGCVVGEHGGGVVRAAAPAVEDDLLAAMLQLVERAELRVDVRTVSERPVRSCVAVGEAIAVQAVLRGREIRLLTLGDGMDAAAHAIADVLGDAPAADLRPVSVPVAEVASRLDTATAAAEYVDALHASGIRDRDAVTIGTALHSWTARSEIVVVRSGAGPAVSPAAVVVLDTAAGRIVVSPSRSPDGVIWTTFASGTRQRLRQALSLLIETLDDGP